MRTKALILCTVVALSQITTASVHAATVITGHVCTKIGATTTSGGKSYVCAKSGSKLKWHLSPARSSKTSPSPKPTPTTTSKNTKSPLPSVSPKPTVTAKPTVTPKPKPKPTPSVTPTPEPSDSQTAPTYLALGQSAVIGSFKVLVNSFNADAGDAVCAANGNNDGCMVNDQKKGVVDPASTTKWVSVTLSLTNVSTQAGNASDGLDQSLIIAGEEVPSIDFVPGVSHLIFDLNLNPGDSGTGQVYFEVDKSASSIQGMKVVQQLSGDGTDISAPDPAEAYFLLS